MPNNVNPEDFIDGRKVEMTPSDWILNKARECSALWEDMSDMQRTQSTLSAIVAWIEMDWMERKGKL